MSWPEVADRALGLIQPYMQYFVGLFCLWWITKIADQSLKSLLSDVVSEFAGLVEAKWNVRTVNAMGLVLLFLLAIFLFFGGVSHIMLPESGGTSHGADMTKGLYVAVLFVFGTFLILCVWMTKRLR